MSGNAEQELLKKLENASPEDAKKLVVESIIPQCQETASSFFTCLEERLSLHNSKQMSLKELDREFNENITPYCMKKFNLEECLKQNGPGH